MTKEIKIGETPVLLRANAATPIRYKTMFHSDLLSDLNQITADGANVDTLSQLAYIMALQGIGSDFSAASVDTFYS